MSNLALTHDRPMNGNALVAANVRAQLGYADITQGVLATHLGLSEMALSRRLKASYAAEFSASEIGQIAAYFGITPGELFEYRAAPATSDLEHRPKDYYADIPTLDSYRVRRAHKAADTQPRPHTPAPLAYLAVAE